MQKFRARIEECYVEVCDIVAENGYEAHEIAKDKYYSGKFVPDKNKGCSYHLTVYQADKEGMSEIELLMEEKENILRYLEEINEQIEKLIAQKCLREEPFGHAKHDPKRLLLVLDTLAINNKREKWYNEQEAEDVTCYNSGRIMRTRGAGNVE